ncbi:MAG: hydrolase [Haloarculaceae archaeon]
MEWSGAAVEHDGTRPTPDDWHSVTVPGRPDRFAGADAVAYRTTFSDPRDGDDEHAILDLRGVYAHARVWCNDELVAEHDAYFDPLRVPLPVESDNDVIVECRRPEDRFGGIHDTDMLPDEDCVPGIWWSVTLESRPDPYIDAVRATPRLTDEGAAVTVEADVVTETPLDDRLTLSLRPEGDLRAGGMMNRARVETDTPGRTTVEHEIDVRDPALWWPHDLGSQPRYAVRVKLDDDERTVVTGLRSIEYGEDGLLVNGQRVPARGVNLTDAEPADIERAAGANANLVRAHAHVLSPAVYEACDEHGLLVWQDLPLTGSGPFGVSRGRDLAERLCATCRHHPSLAAVGVHDDPVPSYADGLGSGVLDRLRYRWRAWRTDYDREAAATVADAVPLDVPVFPVVGRPGIDPDAATLYPGWEFGSADDLAWLCDRYDLGDVVAEFGAGALADADPRETAGFDTDRHAVHVDGGVDQSQAYQSRVLRRVAERLRVRDAHVLAAFALRDAGDAGMGVLSRDGREKAGFEALARAYEPLQVVLADPSPGESDVVAINDRPEAVSATVEWDVDGDREQVELDVPSFGRDVAGTVDLPAGADVTLAVAVGDRVTRNEYDL